MTMILKQSSSRKNIFRHLINPLSGVKSRVQINPRTKSHPAAAGQEIRRTLSPDFAPTMKYAEPDNTWTNCLWKFDLNSK